MQADNTNSERLREYMAARQRIFNEKPERSMRPATNQPSSSRRRGPAKPSNLPNTQSSSSNSPASTAAQWQRAVPSPAAIAEAQRAAEAEKRAEKDRAAEALAAREKALVKAAIQAAAARERERAAEEAQGAVVSITEGTSHSERCKYLIRQSQVRFLCPFFSFRLAPFLVTFGHVLWLTPSFRGAR